ncbi:MAG: protein kinase [Syntrophomonadaceae bacterium]|nr:protein kinase [Syntrophomonadaceae bacterium]
MSIEKLESIWPEWKVVKDIGEGAFGMVYEVVREEHGLTTSAAVKVISIPKNDSEVSSLRAEGISEEASKTYFQGIVDDYVKEIKLMDSFKATPNIVSIEDYKVIEKTDKIGWDIFIRMELLTSLNGYTSDKTLSETDVIKLGEDILSALELCSQKKIIHRDIKPENIFISEFGYFKLGDFGIARKLDKTAGSMSITGSPSYVAPEVVNGGHYDATVDIYSLGIVLYKLLNNNRTPLIDPYKQLILYEERQDAINRRIKGETLPAPVNASSLMTQVILKACAFEPTLRFQTPEEFKAALNAVKEGSYVPAPADLSKTASVRRAPQAEHDEANPIEAIPAAQKRPKKKFSRAKAILITSAAVIVLAAVGAGVYWIKDMTDPSKEVIKLLTEGDYNGALSVYENKMDNSPTSALEKNMRSRLDTIKTEFTNKSIEYSVVSMELNTIKKLNISALDKEIVDLNTYINDINGSRTAFNTANSLYDKKDYVGAMTQYQSVIPTDPDFEAAKTGYANSVSVYRKDILAEAAEAAAGDDYNKADAAIEKGLLVLADDPELTEQRNIYKSQAEMYAAEQTAEYKSDILSSAEEKAKTGDYDGAIAILSRALSRLPNDTDIHNKIEEYTKQKQEAIKQNALVSAQKDADAGDYKKAIDTLNAALRDVPNDSELTEKLSEFKTKADEQLKNDAFASAEENAVNGNPDQAFAILNDALKQLPNDPDIIAKIEEYKKAYGEKANIIRQMNSSSVELYHNEWSSVVPFSINETVYNQDNLVGLRFLYGRWRNSRTSDSVDTTFCGLMLKIDNSNLEYSTMTYQTALDDLSKEQVNKNEYYRTSVIGYSKVLGIKTLYRQDLKRDSEIHTHIIDVLRYEEIYVFLQAYNTWNYEHVNGKTYGDKDDMCTVYQDYMFLFHPRVFNRTE